MITKWDDSLVGKRVTNSHYKEHRWAIEILYVGKNSFFGKEIDPNGIDGGLENSYGFRQFDWELVEDREWRCPACLKEIKYGEMIRTDILTEEGRRKLSAI